MRNIICVGIIMAMALGVLASWPSPEPAGADELIPALKEIPKNLPIYVQERLSQKRKRVEDDYVKFKKAGDEFSGKTAEQQTDTDYEKLMAWRRRHIKDTEAFNGEVTAALTRQAALKKRLTSIIRWGDNWEEGQKEQFVRVLTEFKDEKLRDWIAANMGFERCKPDGVSPISASGSALKIKDDFFLKPLGEQGNLLAFEAGKVFWNIAKGEQTLMNWWLSYDNKYSAVIAKMKRAKYGDPGENLSKVSDPLFEHYSGFGYVFRAVLLPLEKPKARSEQQEWDKAIKDFKAEINKFLPKKQ